jgi:hypothetical protein
MASEVVCGPAALEVDFGIVIHELAGRLKVLTADPATSRCWRRCRWARRIETPVGAEMVTVAVDVSQPPAELVTQVMYAPARELR